MYKSLCSKLEYCSTVIGTQKVFISSPSTGRPAWNGPKKSCKVGYRKISQHIKCDRYATQTRLEDSRTEPCRFKAVYALQDPKQYCSNRGRQIFTKRHKEKITSVSSDQRKQELYTVLAFPSFPRLSFNGINSPVRHARQTRSIPSRPRLRRSNTPASIPNISSISLHNAFLSLLPSGERGGSVVECRTPEQEVRGSKPTAAVLCPWARHFTPRKYWLITQEAMAPSRHDWKIVDWDVKPQHNQPTSSLYLSLLLLIWLIFFIFPFSPSLTPLVIILKAEGLPVFWQKQKSLKKYLCFGSLSHLQ